LGFNNASDYEEIFGAPGLISREISENISNDMDSILTYIIEHSRGNFQNTMQDFRKEVTEDFKNLSITAANHELKLFGRK
jgi:hypothetical protein